MIKRLNFAKKQKLDCLLTNYKDILTIQSEAFPGAIYGIADHKFAVILPDGAVFCPLREVPELAKKLIPGVREEVIAVYEEWGPRHDT